MKVLPIILRVGGWLLIWAFVSEDPAVVAATIVGMFLVLFGFTLDKRWGRE